MRITHCQHKPCGAKLPADADRRTRFCCDAHRHAASRARKAAEKNGDSVAELPVRTQAVVPLADDAKGVWDMLIAQLKSDGLMVIGAAGLPVSHPLLKHYSSVYTAAKEQLGSLPADAEPESEYDMVKRLTMQRLAEYEAEENA